MPAEVPEPIECEIRARHAAHAAVLAEIAVTCARDLGQSLRPRTLRIGKSDLNANPAAAEDEAVLTLRLPAALAGSQHQIWCLACRLACFLPSARVSVLIEATEAFRPSPHSRSLKARRSA